MTDKTAVSRRRAIALAGAGVAGVAGAAGVGGALVRRRRATRRPPDSRPGAVAVPRRAPGRHRHAGPGPAALRRVRRDHQGPRPAGRLLKEWTAAAARMTAGQDAGEIGAVGGHPRGAAGRHRRGDRPAAVRAHPHRRFRPDAVPRRRRPGPFGLADRARRRSPTCRTSPATRSTPAISGGDICVQACANDPQVAVHAIRNLARIGMGVVSVRWSQLGFGRTSSTSTAQATAAQPVRLQGRHRQPQGRGDRPAPRAPLGAARRRPGLDDRRLLPGHPQDPDAGRDLGPHVAGRAGGHRRPDQGRAAPRSAGARSSTSPTWPPTDGDGEPCSRRPRTCGWPTRTPTSGARLLRRGYNFVDGSDGLGRLNAGLFFIAYQRDPRTAFVPVQRTWPATTR